MATKETCADGGDCEHLKTLPNGGSECLGLGYTREHDRAEGLALELLDARLTLTSISDRLQTIADESSGPHSFLPPELAMTEIERALFNERKRADDSISRAEGLAKELAERTSERDAARDASKGNLFYCPDCNALVPRPEARKHDHATARVAELEKQLAEAQQHVCAEADRANKAEAELAAVLRGKDEMGKGLARSLGVPAAPLSNLVDAASSELARLRALPDYREALKTLRDLFLLHEGTNIATYQPNGRGSWPLAGSWPLVEALRAADVAMAAAPLPSAQQIPAPVTPPNADAESLFRFHEAALPLAQAATEYRAAYCSDQPHEMIQKSLDKMVKVARRSSRLADFFVNDRNPKAEGHQTPALQTPPAQPDPVYRCVVCERGYRVNSLNMYATIDGNGACGHAVENIKLDPAQTEGAPLDAKTEKP